jgi:hypothetical protein
VAADVVARIVSESIRGRIAAEGRRVPGPYVEGLTAIMEGRGSSSGISGTSDNYDSVKLGRWGNQIPRWGDFNGSGGGRSEV